MATTSAQTSETSAETADEARPGESGPPAEAPDTPEPPAAAEPRQPEQAWQLGPYAATGGWAPPDSDPSQQPSDLASLTLPSIPRPAPEAGTPAPPTTAETPRDSDKKYSPWRRATDTAFAYAPGPAGAATALTGIWLSTGRVSESVLVGLGMAGTLFTTWWSRNMTAQQKDKKQS